MQDARCTPLPRLVKVSIAADAVLATGCLALLASDAEVGLVGAAAAIGAVLWPTLLARRVLAS